MDKSILAYAPAEVGQSTTDDKRASVFKANKIRIIISVIFIAIVSALYVLGSPSYLPSKSFGTCPGHNSETDIGPVPEFVPSWRFTGYSDQNCAQSTSQLLGLGVSVCESVEPGRFASWTTNADLWKVCIYRTNNCRNVARSYTATQTCQLVGDFQSIKVVAANAAC